MNGNYYPNPTFPNANLNFNEQPSSQVSNINEEIIVNNYNVLLNKNKNKKVKLHLKDKELAGILESVGTDYLVLREVQSEVWNIVKLDDIKVMSVEEKVSY